jgi:hypothetical protein
MKRLATAVLTAMLMTGCTALPLSPGRGSPTLPAISPSGTDAGAVADGMAALMPDREGFQWQYSGFAEYAATMSLKSVERSGNETVYTAEGRVADMSDGEAAGDFSVKITYTATQDSLDQKLTGAKAMDSEIPDLELIRAPLAQGAKWEQNAKRNGSAIAFDCEITGVRAENGRKVYTVAYRQRGGAYYELRDIAEGLGVTSFQKLYPYENGGGLIGYRLDAPAAMADAEAYKQWLPALGKQYTFFGLAEYGHEGTLEQISGNGGEDVYEYRGVYADGIGDESRFVIRYRVDLARGTVTEQFVSNERGGGDVNSKLHNLVILKFPLSLGGHWSHQAKLNGRAVTVQAEVVEYDETRGAAKVRYTAKGATGYYDDTYIEERTFEKGRGMTAFSNLMPGGIGISAADAKDAAKLDEAIRQHSFGYLMNKQAD